MAGGHRFGHVHALYRHGESALHRLAPHTKIVAAFIFVFAVVATPREAIWAFGLYAGALIAAASAARLGTRFIMTRLLIEVPFVLVALALPFIAGGDKITAAGIELSRSGLWSAWNIIAKATLGLLTSVVLAGTTQIPDLLRGLDRLRVPPVITSMMGFMVRYLDVVLGELRRMHVAMHSRGWSPRWLGHAKPYAASIGSVFVRSYERGERVYLAMAARGYAGHMPSSPSDRASARQWSATMALPAAAWATAISALVVT